MATQKILEGMLRNFAGVYGKSEKSINASLIQAWMEALKRFSDEQVLNGASKAMEDCNRFPVPADIIARMERDEIDSSKNRLMRCRNCNRLKWCVEDEDDPGNWLCRNCYSGLSDDAIRRRFEYLANIPNNQIDGESTEDRIARHKHEILDIR